MLTKKMFLIPFLFFGTTEDTYGQTENTIPSTTNRQNKIVAIDINPLILTNQGIGLNAEKLFTEHVALGTSLEYYSQMPYDLHGVRAARNMFNIAPFLRYYFSPQLFGLFIGIKFNVTYSQAEISDNTITANYNNVYFAPTTHFGYRFVANNGFSISAYVGLGIKSSSNKFPDSKLPESRINNQDWLFARDKLNKNVSLLEADYGLTFGYEI